MSRSPVVLVTGALIDIGRAIAIRYGRAWSRAGSCRLLGDVGGGDSRVRADGQPDQHAGEQQHRGVRVIAACMATAPSTPAGHTVLCRRPRTQRSPGISQMCGVGDPSRQRKCSGEDRVRRLSAAEVDGTASADAIELVLTDRISHACKELK
jgi:hypothetical protein